MQRSKAIHHKIEKMACSHVIDMRQSTVCQSWFRMYNCTPIYNIIIMVMISC